MRPKRKRSSTPSRSRRVSRPRRRKAKSSRRKNLVASMAMTVPLGASRARTRVARGSKAHKHLAEELQMAGKFVLKKGTTGKFHFNLVAGNGQVIATSEAYESRESALKGIESVKTNAPGAELDDQTR